MVIELFDEYCPKTCENFRTLCTGYEKKDDNGNAITEKMSYANSEIHRVVKGMYVQAGDLSKIYGKCLLFCIRVVLNSSFAVN